MLLQFRNGSTRDFFITENAHIQQIYLYLVLLEFLFSESKRGVSLLIDLAHNRRLPQVVCQVSQVATAVSSFSVSNCLDDHSEKIEILPVLISVDW